MSSVSEVQNFRVQAKKRKILLFLLFFILLLAVMVLSISFGAGSPRIGEAIQVIMSKIFSFNNTELSKVTEIIIWELRVPRTLLAALAGAGLATSGALMQGALRNPLVSSYILGLSAAAGFGAALAIALGISILTPYGGYVVIANSFVFSFLALLMVYSVARMRGITAESVILAGVAISYLFSALLSFIQYIAPEHTAVRAVVFWLLGSFSSVKWSSLIITSPIVVITTLFMMKFAWDINILNLGEEVATSLGVNPKRLLVTCMVLGTLVTATIISFTGVIGFICLISPHIARMLIGSDYRFVLPFSAIIGACLLLSSDFLSRMVLAPSEVPVGIITSLLGVPFFLYILLSRKRRMW